MIKLLMTMLGMNLHVKTTLFVPALLKLLYFIPVRYKKGKECLVHTCEHITQVPT